MNSRQLEDEIADMKARLAATTDLRKRRRLYDEILLAERQLDRLTQHAGLRGGK